MNGLFPALPLADTLLGTLAIRHRVLGHKKDDDEVVDVDDDMVVTFVFDLILSDQLATQQMDFCLKKNSS